jgi:antirestriction protein ArdC
MDRDFSGVRFGSEAYAFEELVAELGQAFLCAQMGIPHEKLQHASYIQSWLKVLKDDKKAIFTASSQARQSNEWIHSHSSTPVQELAA